MGASHEPPIKSMLATAAPVNTGQIATPSLKVLPLTLIRLPVNAVEEAAHKAYSPLQTAMVWAWMVLTSADTHRKISAKKIFITTP